MTTPKVSVVLPTHNGARFLLESLESCFQQTYTNLEVIVVDDGSTDATCEILRSSADKRLVVRRHETNRGLPEALNTGFRCATGAYLTWTSDDNLYEAEALQAMVEFLELRPEVGLVYTDFWRIDDVGQILEEAPAGPPQALWWDNPIGYCFMYRRVVHDAVGYYDPGARLAEDFDYWVRVYRNFAIEPLHRTLYSYREHERSLTRMNYGGFEARRVCARSRRKWLRLGWRKYARQMAAANIDEAFARYAANDMEGVCSALLRGVAYDPRLLHNRGVIAILGRSVLRGKPLGVMRKARGWLAGTQQV